MKKSALFLLILATLALSACQGTIYHERVDLGGGDTADVVGRTGPFGTDGLAIRFKTPAPKDPDILRLGSYSSRQSTIQTYDQKCPDPKQLKNIRTQTENTVVSSYQDVPNPNKRQDQIAVVGGTNPSTGNVTVPTLVQGGSQIGASAVAPGTNIKMGVSTVQKAPVGTTASTAPVDVCATTTNTNTNTLNNSVPINVGPVSATSN
jgi:hypothetical protein